MDLKDVTATLLKLPEAERAAMLEEVTRATAGMKWVPNPGPQTEAYFHEADEIFYGGQAGGGKTDLEIGLALTEHRNSLLLRRTNKEANGLVERMTQILGSRDGWSSQVGIWRVGERNVEISGCQLEEDKQKFKGAPHDLYCVGRGTPVLMADGSWTPVQCILPGELVQTLEGPRRVLKAFSLPPRTVVELRVQTPQGEVRQIQSENHRVLTPNGWVAPGMSFASSRGRLRVLGSTPAPAPRIPPQESLRKCGSASPAPRSSSRWARSAARLRELVRRVLCSADLLGSSAGTVRPTPGSDCARSGGEPQEPSPQQRCHPLFPVPLSPLVYSTALFSWPLSAKRVGSGALRGSSPPDSPAGCPACSRSCGEHTHAPSGPPPGPRAVLRLALPQGDAGPRNPRHSPDDGAEPARKHSRYSERYAHPYTKEIRRSDFETSECSWSVTPVGEVELFDLEIEEVNHFITFGGIVNKNCFDEVSDFTESQYIFITGWNRTTIRGQRCRIVAAGNPPTRPEGLWVIKRWAAWLDPNHPNPAQPGEIRWYTMGPDEKEIEVNGPGPHMVGGEMVTARSRTFIPAELSDNPDLVDTNYKSVLDGLPPELRAAYRDGRFDLGLKDRDFQVIPTSWVRAAQLRWTPRPPEGVPMCAMGVDVSGGGTDPMEIARRHDHWYDKIIEVPGREIPIDRAGAHCAGLVISHRRDSARVIVDLGGGYGGSTYEQLKANSIDVIGYIGSSEGLGRSAEGGFGFTNRRSAAIWKFREALDPGQPGGSQIMLPDDPTLVADLTAPTYEIVGKKIKVESKLDVKKRLGRSTDRGDAVIMAWTSGLKNANVQGGFKEFRNKMPSVVRRAPKGR